MKKQSHYTFVMVPHDEKSRMRSIKIPAAVVHNLLLLFVFIVSFVAGSFIYNVFLTAKTINFAFALRTSTARAEKIDYFEEETNKLRSAVLDLHLRNNQLRELLGLKVEKPSLKLSAVLDKKLINIASREKNIASALDEASRISNADQKDLKKLKQHVTEVYSKMSAIPSKWPLYGRIVSGYGYRISPWRGFHTGVDIKAEYGSPFRATAPGIVSFAGWRRGYGKTIIIEHEHGFSTLYAHCSFVLVSKGDKIDAGAIIGRVGVTGYSTGSHLHYEVRKNDHHINPMAFLDLKPLTAARILK